MIEGHEVGLSVLLDDNHYNPNKRVKMKIVKDYVKSLESKHTIDIEVLNLKLEDLQKKYDISVEEQKEIQKEVDLESFISNSLSSLYNKIIKGNSNIIREELVNKDKEYAEMKEKLKESREALVEMENKYDKSLLESKNKIDKYDKERKELIESLDRKNEEINRLIKENKRYAEVIDSAYKEISEFSKKMDNMILVPTDEIMK